MTVAALRASRLEARYPSQPSFAPALADVSFDVACGERLLLLGPNGAGKSTLVRLFAGLMRPLGGEVLVHGAPANTAHARQQVGVVTHATGLYEELSAEENLRLFGALYGVDDGRERAESLLHRMALSGRGKERVAHLSRGQQQRVALARALIHDPPVLLLDEPDTGLDAAAFGLLEEIAATEGRTLLLTTHNLAAGLRLGTRVAILARGRIVHEEGEVSTEDAHRLGDVLRHLGSPRARRGAADPTLSGARG